MAPRSPLRVLMLVSNFAITNGVPRYVVELSRALDKQRITPILAALWDYHTDFDQVGLAQLRNEGFTAFIAADWDEAAPYASCRAALQGLYQQLSAPVDIVHTHGEFTDLAALFLRRHVQAKWLVRTVHNEIEWAKRPLFGRIFPQLLYPWVFDAEYAGQRAVQVANALNLERFTNLQVDRAALRASLGIPATATVIGTVGRLVPQKGYHHLIQAARIVLTQQPDTYFLIIGDGILANELRAQAAATGVSERILFTGARADIEALYQTMDAFVSSSLWEGLPTVLMESMASDVPVIATAVAGNQELVIHEQTGLLVPPGDAEALAAAISRMIEQPALAQQLAQRAHQLVHQRFSITSIAQQQADLYEQLGRSTALNGG
jgi:glycosyltransferase involved in cell wall biosynthesis